MGIILVAQMGVRTLGNLRSPFVFITLLLTGCKVRLHDLIRNQLALANSLVLFSRGIPHTMATFGSRNFLIEAGCEFLLFSEGFALA